MEESEKHDVHTSLKSDSSGCVTSFRARGILDEANVGPQTGSETETETRVRNGVITKGPWGGIGHGNTSVT